MNICTYVPIRTYSTKDINDRFKLLFKEVCYLRGNGGTVQTIVAGTDITIDSTDPANPIISYSGTSGTPNLQAVTDEGNTTTNSINITPSATVDAQIQMIGTNANSLLTLSGNSSTISVDATTQAVVLVTSGSDSVYMKAADGQPPEIFLGTTYLYGATAASTLTFPQGTGYLALSVNGEVADEFGAITIPAGAGSSYTVYTALLNQSGTSAPVATVLENTTGSTFSFAYDGTGIYRIIADTPGTLTSNKTWVMIGQHNYGTSGNSLSSYDIIDTSSVYLMCTDPLSTLGTDDFFVNTSLEIRIYP